MLWREGPTVVPAAFQAKVPVDASQAVLIAQQNPANSRAAATAMIVRRLVALFHPGPDPVKPSLRLPRQGKDRGLGAGLASPQRL